MLSLILSCALLSVPVVAVATDAATDVAVATDANTDAVDTTAGVAPAATDVAGAPIVAGVPVDAADRESEWPPFIFSGDGTPVSLGSEHGNVYVISNTITVDSAMTGDIYALGNKLHINAELNGDIGFGGETLDVDEPVNGDVRALVGEDFTVNGNITGEILTLGNSLIVKENAVIVGNVMALVDVLVVEGTIEGDVRVPDVSHIAIYGTVNGTLRAANASSITLHPGAVVNGTIFYSGADDALNVDSSAVVMGERVASPSSGGGDGMLFDFIVLLVALLSSGLLAYLLLRQWWDTIIRTPFRGNSVVGKVMRGGVGTVLLGFVLMIMIPITSLIVMFIPGLYMIALVLLSVWLFLLAFSIFCVPVIVGVAVRGLFTGSMSVTLQSTSIGIAVMLLLSFFAPVLAFIVGVLALLFLVGTFFLCTIYTVFNTAEI